MYAGVSSGEQWQEAAERAIAINPANRPQLELLTRVMPSFKPTQEHIAAMTSKYWKTGKVALTVSFLDVTDSTLQDKILQHMNAWAPRAMLLSPRWRAEDRSESRPLPGMRWANTGPLSAPIFWVLPLINPP